MDEHMKQIVTALKPFFNEINECLGRMEKESAENRTAIRRVAVEVSKLKDEMSEVKDTMATKSAVTSMFKLVCDKIDGFLLVIEVARNERTVADESFKLHENRLDEHDRRLTRLENKPA
ncbi:MAG: hypothetical protein HY077_03775 [Elusimicrobia bacterium]|nr:hypothetical protein [Elusimicrobiota bacterium]